LQAWRLPPNGDPMALVRLFMAARRAPSTRSAASSCIPAAHPGVPWLFTSPVFPVLERAGRTLRNLGIGAGAVSVTVRGPKLTVEERGFPKAVKGAFSKARLMERVNRWAGRPAFAAGQPAQKLRAVTARQVDHPRVAICDRRRRIGWDRSDLRSAE
jgi:hypothetical protein